MLAVIHAKTHHRVSKIPLRSERDDNEIGIDHFRNTDRTCLVVFFMSSIGFVTKITIVFDGDRITIEGNQWNSLHADIPWSTRILKLFR